MADNKNAIEQIYDQLAKVFGGSNPNQFFSMLMPGITLDAKSYAYDTRGNKPAIVQEAESKLTDQMFDVAKVSGSSNGQRLSSQYIQALSVLVPNFNPMMPVLKQTMRDYLNTPVPSGTMVNDKPFTGSLQEYYFRLYENWINVKMAWEQQIIDKKKALEANPKTEKEEYLLWYEHAAEAELAKIDEAMAKVVGVFSPADMDAILGALAAGPGGEIEEAVNIVKDIQLASPNGGFFYPVDLTPDDWFLDLASDIDPVDLLKDPEFIAATISVKRQALRTSISQIQTMLNQMPTKGDIKKAADNLVARQKEYTDAQNALINTYSDNTAAAVEMYLAKHGENADSSGSTETMNELNADAVKASKAKGEEPPAAGAQKKGAALTAQDVKELVEGQKKLVGAQSGLITSSQAVADAGLTLASDQAAYFGELPMLLTRFQSQLADIQNMQDQLSVAIASAGNKKTSPLYKTTTRAAVDKISTDIGKMATDGTSAVDVKKAIVDAVQKTGDDFSELTAAVNAAAGISNAKATDVIAAFGNAAKNAIGVASRQSEISQRFMELRFSFSSTDVSHDSHADSSSTQESWSADLFFGSGGGSSSSSSALNTQDMLDKETEITIGLKATKVDIERGWFDPGVFKLSKDMSSLSSIPVSATGDKMDWNDTATLNNAILPCFPVGFLVVKDVTISFKSASSQLSTVHSVLDSKSAIGGGFLCFSASKSSASHSDTSSLKSKTEGEVVTINMPGPQILGWFLELTPKDNSTKMSPDAIIPNKAINIINFVKQLEQSSQLEKIDQLNRISQLDKVTHIEQMSQLEKLN
jgi:hypothetical protein